MAHTDGVGDSISLPNYAGELFTIGSQEGRTPLLTMTGGLTGGRTTGTDTFIMGNFLSLDAASQSYTVSETSSLSAPASDVYAPSQQTNYIELHQRMFDLSYKKSSMKNYVSGEAVVGEGVVDMGNPQNQRDAHLKQLAVDLEYSMLHGTGTDPSAAATNGKTRGIITAIAADGDTEVDASGAALSKSLIEQLEVAILAKTGPPARPVMFCGAFQAQKINDLYGYAKESETVGGVTLETVALPVLGRVPIAYDPCISTSVLAIIDVAKVAPVFMVVPGKPAVFFEPLAKIGAGQREQLYCQFGVDYGHADLHGYIKDLATS